MPEELLKQADIAMYASKVEGGNTLRFFDQMKQKAIIARVHLENLLRTAIEQQQFQLHYQMQVDRAGQPLGAYSYAASAATKFRVFLLVTKYAAATSIHLIFGNLG
ncbi:hypothetical protein [Neptunomonas antarctica]|uniref:GGDEF domain-containing protein n=1 Tax=Neptunomonas antarctica TaxID=619304 RepID=A0A1N7J6Z6_9GAMM|nr:hypothetical protein [Neptunomonas antarctica]SIS45138.1 hypothetical protein SAMN05421760_101706 [Neptunomonas antarctica]